MHATLETFGYPDTLIRAYEHWAIVLRPAQVTIGSLVLAHTGPAERLSDVPPAAFAELHGVTSDLESTLRTVFAYDKINYLMLMMRDPHVHWHVIPRYAEPVVLDTASFEDAGWPAQPRLAEPHDLTPATFAEVLQRLRAAWPGTAS